MFHADLHIHSKYSRACSRDCDIEHLAWWALRKGITVVGTGDFTHPAWADELKQTLVPAEAGLLRLRPEEEDRLWRTSPRSCGGQVRFMLSAEISTIYRGGERTRKVHHLIYAPTFEAAASITAALSKIGNLASDGRPILGLDSRHLLEITLDGGPGCYLVPAHAWTPWFAVLGSKSGFDVVADCYGDLAAHVFAIETGLSSDPAMNWMCSALDGYRLVSNSDAHSPPMLGREATTFSTGLDYFEMAAALRTGTGLAGTIEFYTEEGKYHLDGHRKCGVRFEPEQSREHGLTCPECGKPLTIGVLHRVAELADRPAGYRPPGAPGFTNVVQLPQVVAEIAGSVLFDMARTPPEGSTRLPSKRAARQHQHPDGDRSAASEPSLLLVLGGTAAITAPPATTPPTIPITAPPATTPRRTVLTRPAATTATSTATTATGTVATTTGTVATTAPGRRSPSGCAPRCAASPPEQPGESHSRSTERRRTYAPRARSWHRSPAAAAPTWNSSSPRSRLAR